MATDYTPCQNGRCLWTMIPISPEQTEIRCPSCGTKHVKDEQGWRRVRVQEG